MRGGATGRRSVEEYRKLYDTKNKETENPKGIPLPKVAAEATTAGGKPLWRTDAEFGAQYTKGVNTAFIKRPAGGTIDAFASCFDLLPSTDVAFRRKLAAAFSKAAQRNAAGELQPGATWLEAELAAGRIYVADVRFSRATETTYADANPLL